MNEIVRKLRPTDYWRISEHESWLEHMASNGFHLVKTGRWFAKFIKGEPKQMRYRIEISYDNKIKSKQRNTYSELGWDYVTGYDNFNIFSSPVELNAPEPHLDPVEQSYTLKELDKEFTLNAIVTTLGFSIQLWMIYYIYFQDSAYILNLIEGRLFQQIVFAVFVLYLIYNSIKSAISVHAFRKTFLVGKPINHNSPWKNRRKIHFIIHAICVLGLIIPLFIQVATNKAIPLHGAPIDLPIILLQDIEQNSNLISKTTHNTLQDNPYYDLLRQQHDLRFLYHENIYKYNWSFFAPVQYYSDEIGIIPNEMWKDNSEVYSPSINAWIYQLRFPSMGSDLIVDLVKKRSIRYEKGSFIEIDNEDFDQLTIFQGDDNLKEIFALKEKAVIHIRYRGYKDNNSIIKSISQKINLISK